MQFIPNIAQTGHDKKYHTKLEALAEANRLGGPILRGWKEIAAYLGVSLSTAHLYHKIWGLPVIRIINKNVMTTTGAIDKWVISVDKVQREMLEQIPDEHKTAGKTAYKLVRRWQKGEL